MTHRDVLVRLGGVLAVVVSVFLIIVVIWHRRESIVSTAVVLAFPWTLARLIGLCAATLVRWKSLGALGYLMLGALLGVPLSILEVLVLGGILVAVLRRVRPRLGTERGLPRAG